jgi:hypothetical protein
MAAVQTSYPVNIAAGQAGMPADMTNFKTDTKIIETVAGIGFGLVVSQGTAARGVTLGGAAPLGITVADITLASTNADKYPRYANAGVMVEGDIWVVTEDDIALGDVVEFNATTGQLGSDGGTRLVGARWMTAASAGGLAIVRLAGMAGHTLPVDAT